MIIEGSSDIVTRCEFKQDATQGATQWLTFRNGWVMVLAPHFINLYKSEAVINDPLGNGLIDSADVPSEWTLVVDETGFVSRYAAGFVGLVDGKAILITPNDIQLFPSADDALRNQNEIIRLALQG